MAQPNPGGPPPTFRSNVNRAKTKKWIEAKSYSYDGDDWGDVDDYDEYGGYDEPPPPLQPSRATGLRQRGQSASQPADQYSGPPAQQPPYGEVRPSHPQQTYSGRSFTQPLQPPSEHRQNSFEPDTEQQGFSRGPPPPTAQRSVTGPYPTSLPQHQPAPQHPQSDLSHLNRSGPNFQNPSSSNVPNRQSIDDEAGYLARDANPRGPQKRFPSPQQPGQPNDDTRLQSATSDKAPLDISSRRDFSPSAMPPPLQPKGSPSPNRGGSRPPRTSSLGQDNAPQLPFAAQAPAVMPSGESANTQSPQRDRASSSQSTKGLPFVRPADIYRRIEEERQRERQSQESSRPSMESIVPRPKPDNNRDINSGGRPRQSSNLNPVQERRQSELAPEGVRSTAEPSAEPEALVQPTEKTPTTSKRFEIKKTSDTQSRTGGPPLGPMLPDVARLSGFGDSFGESFMASPGGLGDFSSPANSNMTPSRKVDESTLQSQQVSRSQAQEKSDAGLQHQPSLGFRSAVHQSFDNAQDQTPLTPSSNGDSSMQRSTSGGTNAISPIISRGSSTATEPWNINLPTIDDVTSPTYQQNVQPVTQRPPSVARKLSPSRIATQPSLETPPPPSFIPGHRRNMSTPSPDNSPARTPAVEANRQLRSPQEVELAEVTPTPTPTESDISADENMKVGSQSTGQYPTPDQLALSEGRGRTAPDQSRILKESASGASPTTPTKAFVSERADSADSSKVRSLADKFEGYGSRPQSSRSNTTPRASMLGHSVPENENLVGPRPVNERLESFRPHLPGGWQSSVSIAPSADINDQAAPTHFKQGASSAFAGHQPNTLNSPRSTADYEVDAPSTVSKMKDASQDAFAAAAIAGSALAASLAAATGIGQEEGKGQESEEEWEKISDDDAELARVRDTSANTVVPPKASMPALDPRVDKDASAAPTPLPKDTPTNTNVSTKPDYFSDASISQPPAIRDQNEGGSRRNSHQLPPLSTNLQPQRTQYESDRLRREIVQELAPNTISEPSTAESNSPYPTSSKYSIDQSAGPKSTPESGGLLRDHGNYWNNDNGGEDGTNAFIGESSETQAMKTKQPHQNAESSDTAADLGATAAVDTPVPRSTQLEQTSDKTVDTSQPSQPSQPSQLSQQEPHVLAHRFSWEAPLQELGPRQGSEPVPIATQADIQAPTHQAPTSDFLRSAVYPEGHSPGGHVPEGRGATSRDMPKRLSDQSSTVAETSTLGLNNSLRSHEGDREAAVGSSNIDVATSGADSRAVEEARRDKELPSYPDDAPEVAQFSAEKQYLDQSSLQTASDGQSYSSPALHDEAPQPTQEKSSPVTPKAVDAPLPPAPMGAQPNIPTFRALLALKTPAERIRAYDNSREQYANHNSGLTHWLAMTTQNLTEHSDLLTTHGRVTTTMQGHKSTPSRSGVSSGPSSNTPTYAPGFSPSGSGGKISSKEVQAKSKDFLHTAGVFGGKGIVAGKGLFSKGKSKFGGASGTDKASNVAVAPSSPDPVPQGMRTPEASRDHKQNQNTDPSLSVPPAQAIEPQRHASESTQSGRNTPSEESVSKGQLGDDERSSDDYESAQSGPDEGKPPPPRSSSLFIGDKNASNGRSQPLPKSTTSSADTARTITHQIANAGPRKDTQSPRSTHSSNKTPTQGNFDHANAMPSVPYSFERTESPQDTTSVFTSPPTSNPSLGVQSPLSILPRSRYSEQNLNAGPAQDVDPAPAQSVDSEAAQSQETPFEIRTNHLLLPTPEFSPLMGENYTGLPVTTELSRDLHSRGLSIGSVPSALDLERPPSPVSPFVPPGEDPLDQRRGRPIVPVHHGIKHDFIEESSVERARRRSPSFSRPFQTGRTSEDSRPFTEPNSQDYLAYRPSSESSEAERPSEHYPNPSSGRGLSRAREQAPEYQGSGQGAPDMPPVDSKPRSRRGSRSSAYLRAIRDSVSPSRKSQARDMSQPSLPDSSRASNSPHSAIRTSNHPDVEEKPRRSSIFGRIKTNNSSRSDQAQSKDNTVPRAVTMPTQSFLTNASIERPIENESPSSSKMNTTNRLTQTLQRASTTVNQPKLEQQGTKKKRFSGIGSLFGRNQKRQSSDQSASRPLQQQHQQQYRQHSGPAAGPNQRFTLDDEDEEVPQPGTGHHVPYRMDIQPTPMEPPRQPQTQPQRDLPAYVQDQMLRQPSTSSNVPRARQSTTVNPQEIIRPSPRNSQLPSQPTTAPNQVTPVGSRPPPAARSTGSWTRFSQNSRSNSNSRHSQTPAPPPQPLVSLSHIDDFVSSPPLGYESRPTQRSWIEGTTPPPKTFSPPPQNPRKENARPAGSESPPPPPPPPKDPRWSKNASSKTPSGHNRTGSTPLQSRPSPAVEQRQSLPPLQTNVQNRRVSARPPSSNNEIPKQAQPSGAMIGVVDKDSMTPEEKRKSRQEEIERGHLTPVAGGSATTSTPQQQQQGKMSVLQEDESVQEKEIAMTAVKDPVGVVGKVEDEEPIVMSATSFPGQMWQPDYLAWEGE